MFFETDEGSWPATRTATTDIYDRSGGTTTLVSSGTGGGLPIFDGASDDGTHVFFDTDDSLAGGDTDSEFDVYERFGGSSTLVSTGSTGGNGAFRATYVGNSASGAQGLVRDDGVARGHATPTRAAARSSTRAATTSTSARAAPPRRSRRPRQRRLRRFLRRRLGRRRARLLPHGRAARAGDTDTRRDVYDRSGGDDDARDDRARPGATAPIDAFFAGNSLDGSHVFFETNESLVARHRHAPGRVRTRRRADYESHLDRARPAATPRSTRSSTAPRSTATRVFFDTSEPLESTDTDASSDVYERLTGAPPTSRSGRTAATPRSARSSTAAPATARGSSSTPGSPWSPPTPTRRATSMRRRVGAYSRARRARRRCASRSCPPTTTARRRTAPTARRSRSRPATRRCRARASSRSAPRTRTAPARTRSGRCFYKVIAGDVRLTVNITDVRLKATLADYTGQLQVDASVARHRQAERGLGDRAGDRGRYELPGRRCRARRRAPTTIGGTCALSTTFNAIVPGAIVASQRAVWELGDTKVFDGGSDNLASTDAEHAVREAGRLRPVAPGLAGLDRDHRPPATVACSRCQHCSR